MERRRMVTQKSELRTRAGMADLIRAPASAKGMERRKTISLIWRKKLRRRGWSGGRRFRRRGGSGGGERWRAAKGERAEIEEKKLEMVTWDHSGESLRRSS
ncbi:hypothetical protein U1Q18_001899 [Sarracenia purpurea var. burkii]